MTSRDEILRRVRSGADHTVELPPQFEAGVTYPDPLAQFTEVLTSVGGRCELADDVLAATAYIEALERDVGAKVICSRVPDVGRSTFNLATCADPHEVEHVELAIFPGELAVAENAAVWVAVPTAVERAMLFLTQHLALIVPREAVVNNLHDAYALLDVAASAFGTWISGPSKTADIEQSLVIGAHGPRSLTVVLVGNLTANRDI